MKQYKYKGETKVLSEWATVLGIEANTLYCRLVRGWTIQRAFETPLWRYPMVGVSKLGKGWRAYYGLEGTQIYLGWFATRELALAARAEAMATKPKKQKVFCNGEKWTGYFNGKGGHKKYIGLFATEKEATAALNKLEANYYRGDDDA